MTEKQAQRLKNKIAKIKKALAADKRYWGGYYHDGGGLRYAPPGLYLKLQDYKGGMRYFNWFEKNFPDDVGFPVFLFEWAVVLFKTGKFELAEKKVNQTFFSNIYILDKFLDKEPLDFKLSLSTSWGMKEMADAFPYSKKQEELADFVEWLEGYVTSDAFYKFANEFIEIEKQLENERPGPKRNRLVKKLYALKGE